MPTSEEQTKAKQTKALGMGVAGFMLSLSTVMVLIKGNVFRSKEVDAIISDSQQYLKGPAFLVGNRDTLLAAEEALRGAGQFLHIFLARVTPSA